MFLRTHLLFLCFFVEDRRNSVSYVFYKVGTIFAVMHKHIRGK